MSQRIALIGNMNNNFFSICRHLRDAGFDAHLFLLDESDHFLPHCDAIDNEYENYTHPVNWHKYYFFDPQLTKIIKRDLQDYKYIIGCDWAPAYLKMIDRQLDVFVPYGGDVLYYTNKKSSLSFIKRVYRQLTMKRPVDPQKTLGQLQIDGIRESKLVICEYGPHIEPYFEKHFKNVNREMITIPIVYDIFHGASDEVVNKFKADEKYFRITEGFKKYRHVFLSQMRHSWKDLGIELSKGNDVIIKAFAKFTHSHPDTALVLFEYGKDVEESKKLINQLDIGSNIIWLPVLERKFILSILKEVDLCIGEMEHSFLSYGVSLEAIIMKTPLVHNFKYAATQSGYDYLYSCFHASNEEELLSVMNKVHDGDFDKEKMVNQSYEWYHDQLVKKLIHYVTEIVHEKDTKAII